MSSLALPREAAPARAVHARCSRALARLGPDAILVVVLLTLATVMLSTVRGDFNIDSWLALVTGREVWQSGIPHGVTLTTVPLGKPWIDQQWLSQLAGYAVYRVGGLGLLAVAGELALVAGVAGAAVAARRLGGSRTAVLLILPLAVVLVFPAREIRTQDFAIPLFAAVAYLVAADVRRPSRRVFWCLPLLVLWANLHGSVTLGAMLVGLHGLLLAWERRRVLGRSSTAWVRPVVLLGAAGLAPTVTPYGLRIVGYYRSTMLGGSLRHAVTEWRPITAVPWLAAALAVMALIALGALWRRRAPSTLWERLVLVVLAAASVSVQRNVLFFGLFALIVVPVWLASAQDGAGPANDPRQALINGGLIGCALVAATVAVAVPLLRSPSAIEFSYQRAGVLTAVRGAVAADPALRIVGDVHLDDWLLWRDPALRGRVASDASFELLTPTQLAGLQDLFSRYGAGWKRFARGYRLLVLDRHFEAATVRGLLAEPGRRVLYDDGERLVILRGRTAAAGG